jgi:hypothetical protein
MANETVCSICGMKSTRKSNVLRHIANKHNGKGEALDIMDYMLKVQSGTLPYPTYSRSSGFATSRAGKSKLHDLLVLHSNDKIKGIVNQLRELTSKGESIGFKLAICANCLTPKLVSYSDSFEPKTDHVCDLLWIRDNPVALENKDMAMALSSQKIPEYMTTIVKELKGFPVRLVVRQNYANVQEQVNEVVKRLANDRLMPFPKDPRHDLLIQGLELQLKAARSSDSNRNVEFNHLDLDSTADYAWLKRACLEGMYEANEQELTQFFSFAHSTIATVTFQRRKYWVILPLQN